ncbi:MAG: acyl-CoA dehydratase activase-related protein [Prevotellaceae bacterium]|jgi:predicted CoA-substrate-specific enzyme activase|nr:acyl-CoA dehydratase activase-related protein [Prevotellaceae bacterium]
MNPQNRYRIGVDVGSTTLKIVVIDAENHIVHKVYRRHKTAFGHILIDEITHIARQFSQGRFSIAITGSAGMGIADRTGIPFVQEVVASIEAVRAFTPDIRTLIDLGGEDAKTVFFNDEKHPDIRMNGSCAGGTGSFIDQMADLMNITETTLDEQALRYKKIYPIASRCGVFAKTDVQNLIARNIPAPDIAMSIFNTVALQSITSLAHGCDMQPPILCIGGPLTFFKALRTAFINLLKIEETDLVLPDNSNYFPALGAALSKEAEMDINTLEEVIDRLKATSDTLPQDTLPPLFANVAEYDAWKVNRHIKHLKRRELQPNEVVACYLGIDSGSTTTKILILDEDETVIFSFYASNEGNPLKKAIEGLTLFYRHASERGVQFHFVSSASTGYGEELIKSALNLDYGIVETMAHLSGAQSVDAQVSFVLDIGGQDMKSIFIRNGVIANIELNESCSSGCGSFLQNFASTMNVSLSQFAQMACEAAHPSDLGSRCTVFMNSKVKQSLRENAMLGDIAAGLAYSVVKNCLFKVLKIANLNLLGDHIVVQGGAFRNEAVYRALELLSGKTVSSTDAPELMGAFGAALYARRMWQIDRQPSRFSTDIPLPNLEEIETKEFFCKGCNNRCNVLRFRFTNGNCCYAGNKCEKVFFSKASAETKGYNAFEMKNSLLFNRSATVNRPLSAARRMTIGIPRALNMFENYPFWHRLFTECGFEVVLSPESNFQLYQRGVGSVMSDNICFPAKVVHGHILALVDAKVDRLFYPIIPKEEKEFGNTVNSYNCPVVSGYPDVIRNAMEVETRYGIPFDKPVITFVSDRALDRTAYNYFKTLGIDRATFNRAFDLALQERHQFKKQLFDNQQAALENALASGKLLFIVAGRPYHADPLIHQKVGQILSDLGVTALTDDVFRPADDRDFKMLNLVSQWSYPNRTVQAAMAVAKLPQNIQLIHLNSFGCGPDAFFLDETGDILKQAGKSHTVLRIDEIASPGSVRLRLRSLIESLKATHPDSISRTSYSGYRVPYTKDDRKKTVLVPWFADFLSPFIPPLAVLGGYTFVNLPKTCKATAELGLIYGNNEVCYPSTLVLGDIINGLQSGQYDRNNVAVAITQTGGQCRATNYLAQIKAGLTHAGFADIPLIAVGFGSTIQNSQEAFDMPYWKLRNIILHTLLYADSLQQMYNASIIREKQHGETQRLFDHYINKGIDCVNRNDHKALLPLLERAVTDFNQLDVEDKMLTRVGLLGEIYVKYNSYGQAHITEWMRSKGMEVVMPPIIDFFVQYFVNVGTNKQNHVQRGNSLSNILTPTLWKWVHARMMRYETCLSGYRYHLSSESVFTKAAYASEILDLSNQFGEGWLIAGEIASFVRRGIDRVVCVQPFGCIANHIVAKGIEKRVKTRYPSVRLLYLDIDGGMAKVNLHNRLHFL